MKVVVRFLFYMFFCFLCISCSENPAGDSNDRSDSKERDKSDGNIADIESDLNGDDGGDDDSIKITGSKMCSLNEDCVLASSGCCNFEYGGEAKAIHKSRVERYNEKLDSECSWEEKKMCEYKDNTVMLEVLCHESRCAVRLL